MIRNVIFFLKGGLYLILNYLVNMTIMGVSLGYTILHRVPNDFHGLHLKNPSINVDIPDVGIGIGLGGNVIKIKMPKNQVKSCYVNISSFALLYYYFCS